MLNQPVMLTVSQLNRYLKAKFEEDGNLTSLFLTGEISNFTNHYKSGHLYFSLKDETAAVRAVMFSSQAARLRFLPKDGMKVIARVRVGIYEASGQYQVYVSDMQPDGLGALNLAYEQLKEKLKKEGLFDPERKHPIPVFPNRIGIVTSPTGAAVEDIKQILKRRYPVAEVILAPVLVQGAGAAPQIVEAIRRFNHLKNIDVLIVGRGGGSLEDLWAFNEESVARAVASSQIPIISAVGHETDFTICDFVADLRAPTPSAAAELATPDKTELLDYLLNCRYSMAHTLQSQLQQWRQRLDHLNDCRYLQDPYTLISDRKETLSILTKEMQSNMERILSSKRTVFSALAGKLDGLSPLKILERGFVYATDQSGKLINSVSDVQNGDMLCLLAKDGRIHCTVNSTELEEPR